MPFDVENQTFMQATWWESFVILSPLPIIVGTMAYLFVWLPRQQTAILNSTDPVGTVLAQSIAAHLKQGLQIRFSHRDYCGLGLRYAENFFIYGEVVDGELLTPSEFAIEQKKWPTRSIRERIEFESEGSFVEWLGGQSNASLLGDGNQRLTRERLVKAHRFCLERPPQDWRLYVG